jgi:chromosome segregation ATPase
MSEVIFNACDLRASQKVVQLEDWNAAQSELAALREELAKVNREKNDVAYRANETFERLNSMTISKAAMRNKLKQCLTDAERRQKAFDDFDPPDNDFGEPL